MDLSETPDLVQKRRPKGPPRRALKSGSERGSTHPLLPLRSSQTSHKYDVPKSQSENKNMDQSEGPELVQKRRPNWPPRRNIKSQTSQIYDEAKSQSLLQSESALKDFLIILGSKKHQVSQNLLEYLEMLKKNEFTENGGIIEDISSGIAKLKTEGLSETAFQDFKRAAGREVRPETEIFIKTRLFAKIMVISYDIGGCFQSLENLSRNKREEIKVTIDSTLRTMVIENMDTNEVKQLTYNIWSLCNSYTKNSQTLLEGDPLKVTIEKSKLPNDETCAAHLQIGTNIRNEPLHLFLWFQNSLFIRKSLNVFSIPLSHFQQTGEDCVKIKLEQRDHRQVVCLYGKHYDNTAAKETRYPEHVISTGELLDSLRNRNVLERRAIRSFQSLARMSDMFLRDVKADIDETDEEGNTLLHHVSCMPTNLRQAENLTWQTRLYARELTTMSPIQLLIHAGANLGAKNASGMTPLIHAMQKGESNQENIKALVCYSKQEEINEVDNEDRTALHHLAKMNTANKVFLTYLTKLLIERGANPTFGDKNGFTSEDTARKCKNTSVENILRNHREHQHDQQDLQNGSNPENCYQKYRKRFHIFGVIFFISAVCLLSVYLGFRYLGPKKKDCGIKNIDCQIGNGAAYTGEVHKTKSGVECQAWSVGTPHRHVFGYLGDHNQCRNHDGTPGVWCYTTEKNKRWELCDVKQCEDCDEAQHTTISTEAPSCPSGWSLYESSCYRFYSSAMSWTQAQAECQKEKAWLASVHNAWIKTFIGGLQKDNFAFIGGSRPAGSNPNIGWEWLDYNFWSYQNWNTGEPSHVVELCLSQYGSSQANKWNDVDCSTSSGLHGSYGYVCQKHWSA